MQRFIQTEEQIRLNIPVSRFDHQINNLIFQGVNLSCLCLKSMLSHQHYVYSLILLFSKTDSLFNLFALVFDFTTLYAVSSSGCTIFSLITQRDGHVRSDVWFGLNRLLLLCPYYLHRCLIVISTNCLTLHQSVNSSLDNKRVYKFAFNQLK